MWGGGGGGDDVGDDERQGRRGRRGGWRGRRAARKSQGDGGRTSSSSSSSSQTNKVSSGFDPSALERGVRAMKLLDASPNAEQALELAMMQEETRQAEAQSRVSEGERAKLDAERALTRERGEMAANLERERRETERYKAEMAQWNEEQQLKLKRKAHEAMLKREQIEFERQQNIRARTEAAIEKKRRATMERQAELDRETAKVRARAEAEGLIERERKNEDILMRRLKIRSREDRQTRVKTIQQMGETVKDVVTDPRTAAYVVGGLSALLFARMGARVAGLYLEAHIGRPSLVRETSRERWPWARLLPGRRHSPLEGTVFSPEVQERLAWVANATVHTKEYGAPFRHVLLHGPPGTGKTLFAKNLAHESGLDYAIITGGDFGPLGRNAVTELHKLCDWAETNSKGTILFIDEADAFLRSGRQLDQQMSEDMRNVVSAYLNRTGTETDKYMVVLATNAPEVLDPAVVDRIDQTVEIELPGPQERKDMLLQFWRKYIVRPTSNMGLLERLRPSARRRVPVDDDMDVEQVLTDVANRTEGYSGRQLAKYVIAVQSAVYGGLAKSVSPALCASVLAMTKDRPHSGVGGGSGGVGSGVGSGGGGVGGGKKDGEHSTSTTAAVLVS